MENENEEMNGEVDTLLSAAGRGALSAVQAQLAAGASANEATPTGSTALMRAAHGGYAEVCSMLLSCSADAAAQDYTYGTTALMLACAAGHASCVSAGLLSAVDMVDTEGRTALLYAARRGQAQCVRLLCAAHARVDAADETGLTPLMGAAQCGHVEVLMLLLEAGTALQAVDEVGSTALHAAAAGGSLAATLLLLRWGACASARDAFSETPRQYDEGCAPHEPTAAAASERRQLIEALDAKAAREREAEGAYADSDY
jgi:ankyrin repeat protein